MIVTWQGRQRIDVQSEIEVMRTVRTPEKEARFLEALTAGASVRAAAYAAGIARSVAYEWRREDAGFHERWDAAIEEGTDALEDAARERAIAVSDTLLIFLLKARRPEKYRDRYDVRAKISLSDDLRNKPIEELRRELAELRAAQDGVGSP